MSLHSYCTRRSIVLGTLRASLGGALVLGLSSCGNERDKPSQTVCADPENMSTSEELMRTSLGYTPKAPNPAKACAACAYFKASAGDCGSCDLLNGSQVNSMGSCNSWSLRSA